MFGLTILIIMLLCVFSQVSADEGSNYIVYFTNSAKLLYDEEQNDFGVVNKTELEYLLAEGVIEWYEEDYAVELMTDDFEKNYNNALFQQKWDLSVINAEYAWALECFGEDIRIGVIDSGSILHADLKNNLLPGYNYISDSDDVTDTIGHGTFVNGIIAAEMNDIGIVGVAPKSKIVPLKCFDIGVTTTVSTICKAMYDAVDKYECKILNMSLGVSQYSKTFENAVNYAVANDCIVVASVGNSGTESLYYPAAFKNVIGVGAVDSNLEVTDFSQKNDSVFVVAPGKNILSTNYNGGYSEKKGTSFSAPMVSGTIAILLGINSKLSLNDIKIILQKSAVDLGEEGYDVSYGYGLVDIEKAVLYAFKNECLFITPIRLTDKESSFNVINITEEKFKGYFLIINYEEGVMCGYTVVPLEISAKENLVLTMQSFSKPYKCFIWKNLDDISAVSNIIS